MYVLEDELSRVRIEENRRNFVLLWKAFFDHRLPRNVIQYGTILADSRQVCSHVPLPAFEIVNLRRVRCLRWMRRI